MHSSLKPLGQLALGVLLVAGTVSGTATDNAVALGVKGRSSSYASIAASGQFVAIVWGGRTFTSPVRISDDDWVLDGCPENGPAMVVDRSQRIHIVWPTLVPGATQARGPTLALFYAMSPDGRRFTPRQQIPTRGVPRHPQIVFGSSDEPIVAWDEQASGTRRVAVARGRVGSEGTASFVRQPVPDSLRAEYPVLALGKDAVIVAWTSGPTGQTVLRAQKLMN